MDKGVFISIEGGEGVGKTTQINALAAALRERGKDVIVTREPGGTEGAEAIRQMLLSGSASRWEPRAEALLFAAARSDHVERLIQPAIRAGKWVISDRYLDSSRAYQGGGSGLSDADILDIHKIGSNGFMPARTLILLLPESEAAARAEARDAGSSDRIQNRNSAFHAQVHRSFEQFAAMEPDRVRLVDASGAPEAVTARLLREIGDLLA
jgi:dTMP kinase